MLTFDIITIFPDVFKEIMNESIMKRAKRAKKVAVRVHDLRRYTKDKHKKVDDRPFGGGPGMVLTAQTLYDCIKKVKGRRKARVIYLSPDGKPYTQKKAGQLSKERNIILICGHYEGIDERVRDLLVDESISIGDYVLTGGEIPAMAVVDSITRLIPGVLGNEESAQQESFQGGLLDCPHYTRPENFRGKKVPSVLLSGNHSAISEWRKAQALKRTKALRPDLLK